MADFRDPWTTRTGAHSDAEFKILRELAWRWEAGVIQQARMVLFNSPSVLAASNAGYPPAEHPPRQLILNGAEVPRRKLAVPIPPVQPVRFRHFGTLYQGRSLEPLLQALFALPRMEAPPRVELELFGVSEWAVPDRVPANVDVRTAGVLPHSVAIQRMGEPAVLVLVQPERFARQIPTKLFEYLCTGNPVLVIGTAESAAWLVARSFERCRLLDLSIPKGHGETVARLVRDWLDGFLWQTTTVEDTRHLTKQAVGEEFVTVIERLTAAESA